MAIVVEELRDSRRFEVKGYTTSGRREFNVRDEDRNPISSATALVTLLNETGNPHFIGSMPDAPSVTIIENASVVSSPAEYIHRCAVTYTDEFGKLPRPEEDDLADDFNVYEEETRPTRYEMPVRYAQQVYVASAGEAPVLAKKWFETSFTMTRIQVDALIRCNASSLTLQQAAGISNQVGKLHPIDGFNYWRFDGARVSYRAISKWHMEYRWTLLGNLPGEDWTEDADGAPISLGPNSEVLPIPALPEHAHHVVVWEDDGTHADGTPRYKPKIIVKNPYEIDETGHLGLPGTPLGL